MDINGPIRISILDREAGGGRELHFTFTEAFQGQNLAQQKADFDAYLQQLFNDIGELDDSDPNRQGMLIVQQVCEQMYPYIADGQMALSETIVVALTPEQKAATDDFKVIDLLKG
jgi:hypothetical protein